MNKLLIIFSLWLNFTNGFAEGQAPAFLSDRWKEDYRYLADQPDNNTYDRLKYLPLMNGRKDIYLSLGGNFRKRLNVYDNDLFGFRP